MDRWIGGQTDRRIGCKADRGTGGQADKETDRQILISQIYVQTNRQTDIFILTVNAQTEIINIKCNGQGDSHLDNMSLTCKCQA